jgi:type VI secretion system secreted protein Hcp
LIADQFLKVEGVTGESGDADHKGEIDVTQWSWGLQAPSDSATGRASGRRRLSELQILKKVDRSTPPLMDALKNNRPIKSVVLTVRKAGKTPLTYFKIELQNARITSVKTESLEADLWDRVNIGFDKVTVTYVQQDATGAKGGGDVVFEDSWGGGESA